MVILIDSYAYLINFNFIVRIAIARMRALTFHKIIGTVFFFAFSVASWIIFICVGVCLRINFRVPTDSKAPPRFFFHR